MSGVQKGQTVRVHYHGKLTTGETFDSSQDRPPLEFQVGQGHVIPGFDNAVLGMNPGEKKSVNIPVDEAYGGRNEEMMIRVDRADLPDDVEPQVGMELQMSDEEGHIIPVVITEVAEDTLLLDANHPLAGKDLVFDIELVEVV